ncbi:MAG: hypothetical protein RJA36_788 [Pseudomonadota bacterium]|jgi:hypothetical protein
MIPAEMKGVALVALRRAIVLLVDAARCSLAEPFSPVARVRLKAQIDAAVRDLRIYQVAELPPEIPAVPVAETPNPTS